jgi:serine/threonine protein kinase
MSEVLKKFGRYFLLDHIAQGGMAEIYRARPISPDGAGRILVIKRIQAGFGGSNEFLQMFKSEIKVMMGFNHPNIVSLYDCGEEEGQPYIAMELVEGKNLRQLMSRFAELRKPFPVELAAYIIEQASAGLHYAHSFKDKISGEALNLVHRDISPQNILISYDGNIKVIDFGIAKATTNVEATRAGVIKGKPSYLSPEQINGDPLDGRSDVFALGICLWELLCGKKLFQGDSDLAILKQIEACSTTVKLPSSINPKIPKELDYIVLRSLAKQREKRYQSADELQRALHKFLYQFSPEFNPADLSYYNKDLFKEEILEDRKKIQKLNEKVEQLLQVVEATQVVEPERNSAPGATAPRREESTAVLQRPKVRSVTEAKPVLPSAEEIDHSSVQIEAPFGSKHHQRNPQTPSSPSVTPAAAPVSGNLRGTRATGAVSANPAPASTVSPERPVAPSPAGVIPGRTGTVSIQRPQVKSVEERDDNAAPARSPLKLALVGAAAVIGIIALGPSVGIEVPFVSKFFGGKTSGEPLAVKTPSGRGIATSAQSPGGSPANMSPNPSVGTGADLSAPVASAPAIPDSGAGTVSGAPARQKQILLKFRFVPATEGVVLTVNQQTVNPEQGVRVDFDTPIRMSAQKPGMPPVLLERSLSSQLFGELSEHTMELELVPSGQGFLSMNAVGNVSFSARVNGADKRLELPFERESLPAGIYDGVVKNETTGQTVSIKVEIRDGRTTNISNFDFTNKEVYYRPQ